MHTPAGVGQQGVGFFTGFFWSVSFLCAQQKGSHLGCSKTWLGAVQTAPSPKRFGPFGGPIGPQKAQRPIRGLQRANKRPKKHFFKGDPGPPSGCPNTYSGPVLRPFGGRDLKQPSQGSSGTASGAFSAHGLCSLANWAPNGPQTGHNGPGMVAAGCFDPVLDCLEAPFDPKRPVLGPIPPPTIGDCHGGSSRGCGEWKGRCTRPAARTSTQPEI